MPRVKQDIRIPGINSPMEIPGINVRGGAIERVVGSVTIPVGVNTGTYTIQSPLIGFTPSFVNLKGFLDGGTRSWCDISMDGSSNAGLYSVGASPRYVDNRAVNLFDSTGSRFQADFIAFTNGGVQVNILRNTHQQPVNIAITAFK